MRLALENYAGCTRIWGIRITNCRYVDDILLVAESKEDLQSMMTRLQDASELMGFTINVEKTATMTLNASQQAGLTVHGNQVTHCDRFKYLAALFTADARAQGNFNSDLILAM